jgi:hypothetical protein
MPARAYSYSALPWCFSAECIGGAARWAGEARAGGFRSRRGRQHRALLDRARLRGRRGRALAQVQRGAVALVGVQADLAELGGGAEAQRQQPGGQRVQRAGMAALFARSRPLAFCKASLLVQPSGLSSSSTPCRARTRACWRPACSVLSRPWPGELALAIKALRSAARSVVRSKWKCSVGTVWIDRRLKRPLRRKPAASFSAASALSSGYPPAPRSTPARAHSPATPRRC